MGAGRAQYSQQLNSTAEHTLVHVWEEVRIIADCTPSLFRPTPTPVLQQIFQHQAVGPHMQWLQGTAHAAQHSLQSAQHRLTSACVTVTRAHQVVQRCSQSGMPMYPQVPHLEAGSMPAHVPHCCCSIAGAGDPASDICAATSVIDASMPDDAERQAKAGQPL